MPGTAVFMTAQPRGTPPALVHNLRHNKVLHEHVIMLTCRRRTPRTSRRIERVTVQPLGYDLFNVARAVTGSWKIPNVPEALRHARASRVCTSMSPT